MCIFLITLITKKILCYSTELNFIKVQKYIQLIFLNKYAAVCVMTSALYWQQSLIQAEHSVKYINTDNLKVKTLQSKTCNFCKFFRLNFQARPLFCLINMMWNTCYNKYLNRCLVPFVTALLVVGFWTKERVNFFFYSNPAIAEAAGSKQIRLHSVATKYVQFEIPNFTCFLGIPNLMLMQCSIVKYSDTN
jgi:hypothetical protein